MYTAARGKKFVNLYVQKMATMAKKVNLKGIAKSEGFTAKVDNIRMYFNFRFEWDRHTSKSLGPPLHHPNLGLLFLLLLFRQLIPHPAHQLQILLELPLLGLLLHWLFALLFQRLLFLLFIAVQIVKGIEQFVFQRFHVADDWAFGASDGLLEVGLGLGVGGELRKERSGSGNKKKVIIIIPDKT